MSGGWNFYSINTAGGLGDYPKFGIWPDGIYMSANLFNFVGGAFVNPRVWALNKAQMYAGAPTVQVVSFNAPSADFAVLPGNARLQTGTPPPGTPDWLRLSSLRGLFSPATRTAAISVRPAIQGLAPGVYRITVTVNFPGNIVRNVAILLLTTQPATAASTGKTGRSAGCAASAYLPLFTSLEQNFSVSSGK